MASQPRSPSLLAALTGAMPQAPATVLVAVACVGVFLSVAGGESLASAADWARWGVYDLRAIRGGAWWGLWTACVVHVDLWHLLFNVYWLWVLGSRVEVELGTPRYLALTLLAAPLSSLAQLVSSDGSGHGYSGVGYALFGFAWVARSRYPSFAPLLNRSTILIWVVWLAGCIVLTELGYAHIGNGAHLGGLACGAALAYGFALRKPLGHLALAALCAALAVAWFWRPWSWTWSAERAWQLQQQGDFEGAARGYERCLGLGGDDLWVRERLVRVYLADGRASELEAAVARLAELDSRAGQSARATVQVHADLLAGVEHAPDATVADLLRGQAALYEWRFAEARSRFESVLAAQPDDAAALLGIAHAVSIDPDATRADREAALPRAERAVELTGRRTADALDALAELVFALGDAARACELADEIEALLGGRSDVPEFMAKRAERYRTVRDEQR